MNDSNPDDAVGYKKPPRKHQFKRGQSGNPHGRPKGTRRLDATIAGILDTTSPSSRRGNRRDAIAWELFSKALHGDTHALEILLRFAFVNDPVESTSGFVIKYGPPPASPPDSSAGSASSDGTSNDNGTPRLAPRNRRDR
jgi:hypothetical protein